MMVCALSNCWRKRAFSRSSSATRLADGSTGRGLRLRFLGARPASTPSARCWRHFDGCDEYSPSRRRILPICPGCEAPATSLAADEARRWMDGSLLAALPSDFPRSRILMVPGNHDVNRQLIGYAAKQTQQGLLREKNQEVIADVLREPKDRAILLHRHDRYIEFANRERPEKPLEVPWWSITETVRGYSVHFVGLCSSWMSSSNKDYGQLLVSRWQVNNLGASPPCV